MPGTTAVATRSQEEIVAETLQHATRHQDAARYREAIAVIARGLEVAPHSRALLQRRAVLLYRIHDYEEALAAYEALLANARPRLLPGDIRKIRMIIRRIRRARSTFLIITARNGPASVFLDDPELGAVCEKQQTCKIPVLRNRTYWVRVERKGYSPFSQRVNVRSRKTRVPVKLQELPSQLTVDVSPGVAQVVLDGKALGTGQQVIPALPAGEHVIEVHSAHHVSGRQRITARLGEPLAVRVTLDKIVPVVVEPAGVAATLTLDDRPVTLKATAPEPGAATPGNPVLHLAPGAHLIRAQAGGYEDANVEIAADHPPGEPVLLRLQRPPPPPPPPPPDSTEWNGLKLAAVGATGLLTGAGFTAATALGFEAREDWNQAMKECQRNEQPGVSCNESGFARASDARERMSMANLSFAGGAAASLGLLLALSMNEKVPEHGGFSLRRKLSIGIAATVTATGLAIGTRHGLLARSRRDDVDASCDDNLCDRPGYVSLHQARQDARLSTLGFAIAGLAATTAGALWWSAPSPSSHAHESPVGKSPGAAIIPSRDGATVTFTGRF